MKRKGREARGSCSVLFSHSGSSHPTGSISGQKGEGWSPFHCSDPCSVAGLLEPRNMLLKKARDIGARQGITRRDCICPGQPSCSLGALLEGTDTMQMGSKQTASKNLDRSQLCKLHCSFSSPWFLHCSLPSDSIRYCMLTKQRISAYHILTQLTLDTTVGQIQMAASSKIRPWALPHT